MKFRLHFRISTPEVIRFETFSDPALLDVCVSQASFLIRDNLSDIVRSSMREYGADFLGAEVKIFIEPVFTGEDIH